MIVLAFDPGGRNTGVVLRDRDTLAGWTLVRRTGDGKQIRDGHYLRGIIHEALALLRAYDLDPADRDAYIVGVEEVAWWPQNTRKGPPRDERGLYATAAVYGALLARWPDAVIVDSGRGVAQLHPSVYPTEIRAPGKGADRLVHCRAAWDHSYAAETVHLTRIREARP